MFYILLSIGLLFLAYLIYQPYLKKRQRQIVARQVFPTHWEEALTHYWPLYRAIPDNLKPTLRQHIKLFLKEKSFYGCQGFEITELHKVFIAAQACLLIINKSFDHFEKLQSILVYPSAFVVARNQPDGNGIYSEDPRILSGESWQTGKIIVSWDDTMAGMINSHDGVNVVIHEFAHLLDQESGGANGAPYLAEQSDYLRWSKVFTEAYERLKQAFVIGQPWFINSYAATSPGEFFAVVSEMFFEKAPILALHEPSLYQELKRYYQVDPANW